MNARLYDPVLGRMLSVDNFVNSGTQGLNRYSYAGNNPLNRVDPNGNFWHIVAGAAIGAGADLITQLWNNRGTDRQIDWKSVGISAVSGAVGAAVGLPVGGWAAKTFTAGSTIVRGAVAGAVTGAVSGAASGFIGATLWGKDPVNGAIRGAAWGGLTGGIFGAIGGHRAANKAPHPGDDSVGDYDPSINPDPSSSSRDHKIGFEKLQGGNIVNDPIAEGWVWNGHNWVPPTTSPNYITLGVRQYLGGFTNFVNTKYPYAKATNWNTWAPERDGELFEFIFKNQINNPNTRIMFNTALPNGTEMNMNNIMSQVRNSANLNSIESWKTITSWEYYMIHNNPSALNRTTFFIHR